MKALYRQWSSPAATIVIVWMMLLSISVVAQDDVRRPGRFLSPGRGFGPGVDIVGVQPLDLSTPVVGIPFSAVSVTEIAQQFADGNRVDQRTVGSVARDSAGRIRREQTLSGLLGPQSGKPVKIVTITIPAERVQYRLDDDRKTAWRVRMPPALGTLQPRGRGVAPLQPQLKIEQLGATQFEGVWIEGTRTIFTVSAGSIGNERAIEVVSERWYSPDLQIVVRTHRADPRFGDVSYRLENIVRSEPPAYLFELPGGYTTRDQHPFGPMVQ
jgi:hypothetical protein